MCGYLQEFSKDKINTIKFNNASDILEHRGPDHTGYYENNNKTQEDFDYRFGFKRLAILDLKDNANQPMSDKSKEFTIVFNGEIYNSKAIRHQLERKGVQFTTSHSDTETILEGFKQWGSSIVQKLEGQFSFTIFDEKNRKLFIARDRIGQKPIYYMISQNQILVSSSIKPILELSKESKKISSTNIFTYLQLGVFPSPLTPVQNIHELEPAHYLEIDLINFQLLSKIKYWDLKDFVDYKYFNQEKFNDLFSKAVEKRCVADVKVAGFLSGGLDSTAVSKEAMKHINNFETFSVSHTNAEYDESIWINQAKEILNLENTTIEINNELVLSELFNAIDSYDEPFSDSSAIPTYLVSKLISKYTKVALSGDGGDELLGGYTRYGWARYNSLTPRPIRQISDGLANYLISRNVISDGTNQYLSMLRTDISKRYESFFIDPNVIKSNNDFLVDFIGRYWVETKDEVKSMQLTDFNFYLPEMMMTKVDRASMANSIEVRSPFVDHHLIEYIISVSSNGYSQLRNKKIPLKNYLESDFDSNFLHRKKMGFAVPLSQWLKGILKEDILHNLNNKNSYVYEQFGNIGNKYFDELENGKKVYINRIWRLYLLNRWISKL